MFCPERPDPIYPKRRPAWEPRTHPRESSPFGFFLLSSLFGREGEGRDHQKKTKVMGDVKVDDDAILKSFLAEVGEVERDNEVVRFLSPKPNLAPIPDPSRV